MKIEIWRFLYHDNSETPCYSPGGLRTMASFRILVRTRQKTVTSYVHYTEHKTLHWIFAHADECRNNIMNTKF